MGTYRQVVRTERFTIFINDKQGRNQLFITWFYNHFFLETSLLVDFYLVSNPLFDIFVSDFTRVFRDDYSVVWIPLEKQSAFFHFLFIFYKDVSTIRDIVCLKHHFSSRVENAELRWTNYHIYRVLFVVFTANYTQIFYFDDTIKTGFSFVFFGYVTGNPSRVESTQGKLSTRLTDRLGSNYPYSFPFLNHTTSRKVATVTFCTNTVFCFTGKCRAHFYHIDRCSIYFIYYFFSNFFTSSYEELFGKRIIYIVEWHTTQDAFAKGFYNFLILFERTYFYPAQGTAIFGVDDYVLWNVYQTTS